MTKPTSPTPETIAGGLTARERVIPFCAATDIDHAAVGIVTSAMQIMEVRGLIERNHSTSHYVLTDNGHAVFRALLKRGPTFRPRRMMVPDIVPTEPEVIPQIAPTEPEVIPQIVPTEPEVIPQIVPTEPEVIPRIVPTEPQIVPPFQTPVVQPTQPEVIPQIVPGTRSEHPAIVGCRYVRTLHATLHVARNSRLVRSYGRRSQLAGPLQHRPDRHRRGREACR